MNEFSPWKDSKVPEELANQFVAVFSRFEYALKAAGYLAASEKGTVWATWDKFANDHNGEFDPSASEELKEASSYLRDKPPRKQTVKDGRLDWKIVTRSEKGLLALLLSVRCVRNNLLHGGKYGCPAEEGRDAQLVKHSLVVLEACLALDDMVGANFKE